MLKIERIYTKPLDLTGYRILVDRKWARGISKTAAKLDNWAKQIAPSTQLREWFEHVDAKFPEFQVRYFQELDQNPATTEFVKLVAGHLKTGDVILLYGAKNTQHNNAVALHAYLSNRLSLPSESENELLTLLYNDGNTNRDQKVSIAFEWLSHHPHVVSRLGVRLSDNNKVYLGPAMKPLNHQELLELVEAKLV
ncbi:DUF488 family protein [Lactobacillus sp. Sy-1]|nr:DUF488 family protein [Lactobacillus sp. Sy-1]